MRGLRRGEVHHVHGLQRQLQGVGRGTEEDGEMQRADRVVSSAHLQRTLPAADRRTLPTDRLVGTSALDFDDHLSVELPWRWALLDYHRILRGIRKTFENCNAVRSTLESHRVQIEERDISMDSGYREELRSLMGLKEVSIPVVFVKGRLIGGAEEVLKLEEEGKLGPLLEELPRATVACEACAGVRFVMCMDCRGSCKVLDEEQKKIAKCKECNENGLIHCPICC
ncbi:hypothetical protein ZIOFF_063413 [Zingiber officinale]|uniref:Glutaredoxin domain-containing protein n=1 Tax=Zingiber officinale TaxID=94328 RepID=A0A8J5KB77_ZINOF|nr:hypothetical protein ZIOFF_063413 [Zingiber officinale]